MLKDSDWRKLHNSTKVLYIYMRAKFNNENLSEITLAYSELKDMMSTATISNALKELINSKWIEKTKYGGLFGGVCKYKFIGKYKDYYYKGYKV